MLYVCMNNNSRNSSIYIHIWWSDIIAARSRGTRLPRFSSLNQAACSIAIDFERTVVNNNNSSTSPSGRRRDRRAGQVRRAHNGHWLKILFSSLGERFLVLAVCHETKKGHSIRGYFLANSRKQLQIDLLLLFVSGSICLARESDPNHMAFYYQPWALRRWASQLRRQGQRRPKLTTYKTTTIITLLVAPPW